MPGLEVILVDDHPLFTRGLALVLAADAEQRVVVTGTTDKASMAVDLVRRCEPDLALVDLGMPAPGGIGAIAAMKRFSPNLPVVALSGLDDAEMAVGALAAGADGYLPKSTDPEHLVGPLLVAAEGLSVVPSALLQRLRATAIREGAQLLRGLDEGQRHLLRAVASGRSTEDLARELVVSDRTAKRMVAALLRRLGVSNRLQAAALAGRAGLLD